MSSILFSIQAPILVDSNYEFWSMRMQVFLQIQGCWDFVQSIFQEPNATTIVGMTIS